MMENFTRSLFIFTLGLACYTQVQADVRSAIESGISNQEIARSRPAQTGAGMNAGAPSADLSSPTAVAQKESKVEVGASRARRSSPRKRKPANHH